MLFLAGIGGSLFNTTNQTVVQLIAPDHLRGRITSVMQVQPICMAVGTLTAGALADVFGAVAVTAAFNFTAFGIALSVLVFSPRMRGAASQQARRDAAQLNDGGSAFALNAGMTSLARRSSCSRIELCGVAIGWLMVTRRSPG